MSRSRKCGVGRGGQVGTLDRECVVLLDALRNAGVD